ncbi:catenin delta-2 [Phlebotomus papatasi]|uniref:catenin delta-2 n=1 Tax=Phlebotomus papatasi TaxID=29031 RepID=UPI0024844720|nr:catenin delta-2 [Phlebotomus papatasi]
MLQGKSKEDMQQYKMRQSEAVGQPSYHHNHSNGHSDHSPNSSHLSLLAEEEGQLIGSRGHHQHHKGATTQQVTTVTKVVREVKHLPNTSSLDYVSMPLDVQSLGDTDEPSVDYVTMPLGLFPRSQYVQYNHMEQPHHIYVHGCSSGQNSDGVPFHAHYSDYDAYAPQYANAPEAVLTFASGAPGDGTDASSRTPPSPSDQSTSPTQLLGQSGQGALDEAAGGYHLQSGYDDMPDYHLSPSPRGLDRYGDEAAQMAYGYISASPYVAAGRAALVYEAPPDTEGHIKDSHNGPPGGGRLYGTEEELQQHLSALSVHGHALLAGDGVASPAAGLDDEQRRVRWRDPNLTEVIGFLANSSAIVKANAAAYLQHLCYMDDPNKQRTRTLGGIPPLVALLEHDNGDVYRNACGALRNLSYGRQNDENKRAIKAAGGIGALIALLRRTTESEVKELVTGVIWNMSSCEDLKRAIIDDGVSVIVTFVIIPHSGWDAVNPGETCWSTVFRNASGVLRNVSSAGEYARTRLRECEGLVDSLLHVIRTAIDKSNIGNKIVENCVCILRNLSYRCQEVEDPNYDHHPLPAAFGGNRNSSGTKASASENLGCFGASRKKKDVSGGGGAGDKASASASTLTSRPRPESTKGYELLWQPDVVQSYLTLLQSCSNPETLEAAAGALQNLAACYWQPSIEIRAAVRKEKGLPILVELLRMEVDRVVCAVATALRNLAIDQRNKELIGKYAMRDLVQKLPSGNPQHDQGTSDDTIAAVLATLNEVIKKNAEFSRSLLDAGGVERLMNITRQRQKYTPRVTKFTGQVLFTMWQHQELRDVYKKHGWREQDFVTKTVAARNATPNSPNNANSTLNRPMASQSGTRYEDRTIKRTPAPRNNGAPQRPPQAPLYQRPQSHSN